MTRTENIEITQYTPKRVAMVTFDEAHIIDIAGPAGVLVSVDHFLEGNAHAYDIRVIGPKVGPVGTYGGIRVCADQSYQQAMDDTDDLDTLIVVGSHDARDCLTDNALLDYVRLAAAKARRVVSICTGAVILAEAGLLKGKRAATHWWWLPVFARDYPETTFDEDAIFVRDGNVWTSAGVTAGLDLALALIEEDFGHQMALNVARIQVMYMIRPGGQSQYSAQLLAQKAEDPAIAKALSYINEALTDDLTVTALAAKAGMSERSFARKFKDETGHTPANYVEAARLQAARVELEQSELSIEQVAFTVGFLNAERMRRAFQRQLGISASDYRERFRSSHSQQESRE